MSSWLIKFQSSIAGIAIGFSCFFSAVYADDTEVFFGQLDPNSKIFPNVMLVLDSSGSMNRSDSGIEHKRITRMKAALHQVLENAANVNIGLMEYTGGGGGLGPVRYPITYIDEPVCEYALCGEIAVTSKIRSDDDDASEEPDGGSTTLHADHVTLGQTGTSGFSSREIGTVGLRFQQLQIPSGATITSAKLVLSAHNDSTDTGSSAWIRIRAENEDNSEPFNALAGDISSRSRTSAQRDWYPRSWTASSGTDVNGDPLPANNYESPDVKNVIQEVIDRSGWCGGNSLSLIVRGIFGSRDAIAFEQSPQDSATLEVTYKADNIPAGMGCIQKTLIARVSDSIDDAEQLDGGKGSTDIGNSQLQMARSSVNLLVGTRFNNIDIPQATSIQSAWLEFEVDEYNADRVTLEIYGEDSDNAAAFAPSKRNISMRSGTAASELWEPPAVEVDGRLLSPDISAVVQEIVNRRGWESGNSLALISKHVSGSGKRIVKSANHNETDAAPKLKINYKVYITTTSTPTYLTARDQLKEIVTGLKSTGGTEIVNTMLQASNYYAGRPVTSDAGSLVDYPSPLTSSCQTNHIVYLTDGGPTANSKVADVESLINGTCDGSGAGTCGPDLAAFMYEVDQSSSLVGVQKISTHTIGLSTTDPYLGALADAGRGTYLTVNTTEELTSAYLDILGEVMSVDTSFVAPGTTVNQFDRLTHRNDIYFSLFKPEDRPTWGGNIKKYQLLKAGDGVVRIHDNSNPPKLAVEPKTGFFADGTTSFWTTDGPDGSDVDAGGAASLLSLTHGKAEDRKIYTYTGTTAPDFVNLNQPAHKLHENNYFNITKSMLGIMDESADYHADLLKWTRGVDVKDGDRDGDIAEIRKHIGDPIHSKPLLVNYADTDSTIYVTTNEGFLHGFDHETGEEEFAFIPQELLKNLNLNYENKSFTSHPYGLDGYMSVWTNDSNNNHIVDNGESAHLSFGMRRGGRNYYSVDVTDRDNPKLNWIIKGGSTGFEELGQSWSKMIPTAIHDGTSKRDVLVFAGGYDVNQDYDTDTGVAVRSTDSVGRAIYIVDAQTGAQIWTGHGGLTFAGKGEDQYFSDMQYSIPSDIRVIDINFDGIVDQMYVGDMGGQVWRFDVRPPGASGALVQGGVMAELATDGVTSKVRRFFYEPDVSVISDDGNRYLSIAIGSGWRAHPLDTTIEDSFFMLRTNHVYSAPTHYGVYDSDSMSYRKISENDLVDVTGTTNTAIDWNSKHGWRLNMTGNGEKILGKSVTFNYQVIFSSYAPEKSVGECDTAIGGGRSYVVNIRDGNPTIDLDGSGSYTHEDRSRELAHAGIPPDPTILITSEGDPIILVGPEQPLDEFEFGGLTQRTFWVELDKHL